MPARDHVDDVGGARGGSYPGEDQRGPRSAQEPKRTKAGATGRAKRGSKKRPNAFSTMMPSAAAASAKSTAAPGGRRTTNATSPSAIHRSSRGYHRDAWSRRSASCALPVLDGRFAKRPSRRCWMSSNRWWYPRLQKAKWCAVAEVQTSRMQLSGREIHTLCPLGTG